MNRRELTDSVKESCVEIGNTFSYKNQDYGADNDAFANFRKTAQRLVIPFMARYNVPLAEKDAMFLVMQILQDKHLVALSQTGLKGNEVAERLVDVATYSLLMKALYTEGITNG